MRHPPDFWFWLKLLSLPVEAGSFLPAFLVLNKDTKHQPEPSRRRGEKAENGHTGITKYAKAGLDLHQE